VGEKSLNGLGGKAWQNNSVTTKTTVKVKLIGKKKKNVKMEKKEQKKRRNWERRGKEKTASSENQLGKGG